MAWVHNSVTPVADAAGRPKNIVALAQDVTERRRSAEALRESRRRLQALFENALDAILLLDDHGRYVDANPAATDLLGYDRAELLTMTAMQVSPPGYQAQASEALRAVVEWSPTSGAGSGISRPTTWRGRASCTRLFGVTPGEFRPSYESSLERVHPEDRGFIDDLCQKSAREGSNYAYDGRIVRPNGEVRFIHAGTRRARSRRERHPHDRDRPGHYRSASVSWWRRLSMSWGGSRGDCGSPIAKSPPDSV